MSADPRAKVPRRARAALVVTLALCVAGLAAWRFTRPRYDWLFVYVMAYDNDLDRCAAPITDALTRAAREHEGVAVAILSDRVARDGLRQTLITHDSTREERVATEDIADPRALRSFLEWASRVAPARRYVVVFLDHGGALDQMGYDLRSSRAPTNAPETKWMSARATGDALRAWRRGAGRDVPLVFLQQCGRASIENLVNFRATSDAVLASQREVGACNTYYEALVATASARRDASAHELARSIMATDRNYTTYALVRGSALDEWKRESDALVAALIDGDGPSPTEESVAALRPCFTSGIERNYDLVQLAAAAAAPRGEAGERAVRRFAAWVHDRLVIEHRRRPGAPESAAWCGVSAMVPMLGTLLDLYSAQPVYRDTRWGALTRALAPQEIVVRPRRVAQGR